MEDMLPRNCHVMIHPGWSTLRQPSNHAGQGNPHCSYLSKMSNWSLTLYISSIHPVCHCSDTLISSDWIGREVWWCKMFYPHLPQRYLYIKKFCLRFWLNSMKNQFASIGTSIEHFLNLPVISVEYDPTAENGITGLFEQDLYPCPHFLLEMRSIQDTTDFFMQNPSVMKKLNLAHYVVILKKVSLMFVSHCLINFNFLFFRLNLWHILPTSHKAH